MNYPRMLFPAGDVAQAEKIVHSADEEADARKAGYRIAHEGKAKAAVAEVEVDPPSDDAEAAEAGDEATEAAPPIDPPAPAKRKKRKAGSTKAK